MIGAIGTSEDQIGRGCRGTNESGRARMRRGRRIKISRLFGLQERRHCWLSCGWTAGKVVGKLEKQDGVKWS